ncbi:MAG: tRNA-specific adenosine deaminase, partial [Oscillospiraceae bacterium]|nr:tRNA-specific adenosine deaminase [Oscillospiraceae bacterium]
INSRIERVIYGASDAKAGSCGSVTDLFSLPYNHRPVTQGGVLADECGSILTDFFKELRKRE